jgi:hypothetical protein
MSAQHTPGPWLRIDTADYAEIHAAFRPSSQAVALVGKPSDADLIAAAPELEIALESLLSRYAEFSDESLPVEGEWRDQIITARAALRKARGQVSA